LADKRPRRLDGAVNPLCGSRTPHARCATRQARQTFSLDGIFDDAD
jgi:hypothetical protein